jgi:hypothetical protein
MIYKLKRYSKSTIPMRKPDIKFRNNKQEYNNQKQEEETVDDYYIKNNDDDYSQQIN